MVESSTQNDITQAGSLLGPGFVVLGYGISAAALQALLAA